MRRIRQPSWYDPVIRAQTLNNKIRVSDTECIYQLRMDRRCFQVLCSLVREIGGVKDTRNMSVDEMVAEPMVLMEVIFIYLINSRILFSYYVPF